MMASGVQDPKPAACKPKAAKTLEIKTEEDVHAPATGAQDNQQTHIRYGGGGGYRGPGGSGGRQGSGGGRGAGRGGGRSAYGPPGGYKSIAQRKAETSCGHCGEAGHWWRECRIRLAEETKMEQENAASSNQAAVEAGTLLPVDEGHPGGSTRPCGRTSARAARRVQTRTTAQEAGLERSEGQAPARLAKRKSGGVENVRGLTQRKSGDDHGTVEVPGKDDEVESPAEAKHVEEETTGTPDEGDTDSSAARTADESAAESILAEMEEAEGSGQPASTTAATAGSSDEADRAHTAEEDHASKPRKGLTRQQLLVSGGRTVAARRRQRRTEQELATLQGILMPELRERRAERAKVLRLIVKTLITEVNTAVDAGGKKQRQRSVQAVVAEARQVELAAMNQGRSDVKDAPQTVARKKTRRDESRATATAVIEKNKTEDEWLECLRQYALELPEELVEEGTLAEMRAARRSSAKAVKRYKIARRGYRLQRRRRMMDQVRATEAAKPVQQRRRIKHGYHYERQGHYGDVDLVPDAKGKPLRAHARGTPRQLRAV
ncbi:hypothetical protein PF011_g30163 [Phytophthora fragariae]|uniref:CCHC-type domain-containing protein n=1 Tax=Phytophthora fragariae TaxID=53985 RepID=A0A6A3GTB5_9STRA|nr:hypothetical protein PF011_g30163 [Phytophthora fragariae]